MRKMTEIMRGWRFLRDVAEPPNAMPNGGEPIDLPHSWNASDGQDGGGDYFRSACCYLRELAMRELPPGELYFLEVTGANSSADVYLNGERLAHHDGGYSTFRVELTDALKSENLLAIVVDNSPNDRVYPQFADFTFYGGLYREVKIIATDSTHFSLMPHGTSGICVMPRVVGKAAAVKVECEAEGLKAGDRVTVELLDRGGKIVAFGEGLTESLTIEGVHLWDGAFDPYRYTARASILREGRLVDRIETKFGCRSFFVDPDRGFFLNGRAYPLRGVSRHQDRPGLGNAISLCHHEEDMALIREMGANAIRLAHYQHDSRFYELCDRYGMVVWAEIPYISRQLPNGDQNAEQQLTELITQCRNHPSIAFWGLSNEITMGGSSPELLDLHRRLNELAHRLDPTRPTAIACLTVCAPDDPLLAIPDLVAYNHYFGWYGGKYDAYGPWFDRFHQAYPQRPIGVSEYGCEALDFHSSSPEAGDYSEEYQARYHEALILQLYRRPYLFASYVWNMFDFGADARAEGGEHGINHKGLVSFDRQYKKDAFYAYKAWLSSTPFVHIAGKRYVERAESESEVTVYSNQPEVELFANGKSLGRRKCETHFFRFKLRLDGEVRLAAIAGELRDEAVIRRVDSPNERYILRESTTVLNWFEISAPSGRFSLRDKLGEIAAADGGEQFLADFYRMLAEKQGDEGGMPAFSGEMLNMISSFTLLRLVGMLEMQGVSLSREELLALNRQLNRIEKLS